MVKAFLVLACVFLFSTFTAAQTGTHATRSRALEFGLKLGVLPTGPLDAITDANGVEVGHTTIIRGDNIRTGVLRLRKPSGSLSPRNEFVPHAVHGSKIFRMLRIELQLVSQFHDMIVDSPGAGIIFISPDLVQKVVPRNWSIWIRQEKPEKPEFQRRHSDRSIASINFHSIEIYRNLAKIDDSGCLWSGSRVFKFSADLRHELLPR